MRRPGAIFSHTCSHVLVEAIRSAIPELSTKRPADLKNVGRSLASLDVVISMIGGDAQTKRRLKHGRTLHLRGGSLSARQPATIYPPRSLPGVPGPHPLPLCRGRQDRKRSHCNSLLPVP